MSTLHRCIHSDCVCIKKTNKIFNFYFFFRMGKLVLLSMDTTSYRPTFGNRENSVKHKSVTETLEVKIPRWQFKMTREP